MVACYGSGSAVGGRGQPHDDDECVYDEYDYDAVDDDVVFLLCCGLCYDDDDGFVDDDNAVYDDADEQYRTLPITSKAVITNQPH